MKLRLKVKLRIWIYNLIILKKEAFQNDLLPFQLYKPLYVELDGWDEDITHVTSFDELPENAKKYLKKIEELTKCEVVIFSVGPDRKQTIRLKEFF